MSKKRRKNSQAIVTYKIPYSCENLNEILSYIKQYNSVLRFTYNKRLDNKDLDLSAEEFDKFIRKLQNQMNNVELIGSHLKDSANIKAKGLIEKHELDPIIFGGKNLFLHRCNDKISKEEFKLKRLSPLYSVGESNQHGNRMFQLLDLETVLFKPSKQKHFILKLHSIGQNRLETLKRLIVLQNTKSIPITYFLDMNYIYITFDMNRIDHQEYNVIQNRVIAVDTNPNYVGYTVLDWKSSTEYQIIDSGFYEIKPLNDYSNSLKVSSDSPKAKYVTNKRKHELIHIAIELATKAKHYKCEVFAIEDLSIPTTNTKKGRKYNRLVNNSWNRNLLLNQIKKHINCSSTTLVEVDPAYTSKLGNILYRKEYLVDACLASIEIGRRGLEFFNQYISKRKPKEKIVIFPNLSSVKSILIQSLEELNMCNELDSWKDFTSLVKDSKARYRVSYLESLSRYSGVLFRKFHKRKFLNTYIYL